MTRIGVRDERKLRAPELLESAYAHDLKPHLRTRVRALRTYDASEYVGPTPSSGMPNVVSVAGAYGRCGRDGVPSLVFPRSAERR